MQARDKLPSLPTRSPHAALPRPLFYDAGECRAGWRDKPPSWPAKKKVVDQLFETNEPMSGVGPV
jgi:hypothetical protein